MIFKKVARIITSLFGKVNAFLGAIFGRYRFKVPKIELAEYLT